MLTLTSFGESHGPAIGGVLDGVPAGMPVGLNAAIAATGAERVFVTHGYTAPFARWLEERGYQSGIVQTAFDGESLDTSDGAGVAA